MSEKKKVAFISGKDIRIWRISRGLKQDELGQFLGLGRTAVGEIEKRGGDQILALALAAVDRGLKPIAITKEDRRAYKQSGGKISRSEPSGPEDAEASRPRAVQ